MGNEAGDTDSVVSALTYAYHLDHLGANRQSAIALLQRHEDALALRPENELALKRSHLKHDNLLTLSDLTMSRLDLASMIGGLVLVDHNQLLSDWGPIGERKVVALLDHHHDKGLCSSLGWSSS
jgi:exopolyphosphatase